MGYELMGIIMGNTQDEPTEDSWIHGCLTIRLCHPTEKDFINWWWFELQISPQESDLWRIHGCLTDQLWMVWTPESGLGEYGPVPENHRWVNSFCSKSLRIWKAPPRVGCDGMNCVQRRHLSEGGGASISLWGLPVLVKMERSSPPWKAPIYFVYPRNHFPGSVHPSFFVDLPYLPDS